MLGMCWLPCAVLECLPCATPSPARSQTVRRGKICAESMAVCVFRARAVSRVPCILQLDYYTSRRQCKATVLSRKSPLPPARTASACAPSARVARHAGDSGPRASRGETQLSERHRGRRAARDSCQSRSPWAPARAASACAPPARVARRAGDPTARAREPLKSEQQAPEDIRAARRPHPASSETREDRARRPRRELVSTVLDHARERGPTDGEPDDVLTISVDAAAFDGRPTASASSRSTRSTTAVARGTPGLSGTHRGREGRVGHAGGAQQRRTRARVSPRVWV